MLFFYRGRCAVVESSLFFARASCYFAPCTRVLIMNRCAAVLFTVVVVVAGVAAEVAVEVVVTMVVVVAAAVAAVA